MKNAGKHRAGARQGGALVLVTTTLLGLGACLDSEPSSPVARSSAALTPATQITIRLPATVAPAQVVLSADGALRVADRVAIQTNGSVATGLANAGATETTVGVSARVRDIWSVASVVLRDRARADGSVRSEGTVTPLGGAVVTGQTVQHATLSPLSLTSWSVTLPASNAGDVNLEPDTQRTLAPGAYRNLSVKSRATLNLTAGTYFFQAAAIEPQAIIGLTTTGGPVVVYLSGALTFRGSILDRQDRADFLVVALGPSPVVIDSAFTGTIVAPQAPLTLATATHAGAFFARDIDVRPDVVLVARPFPALPPGPCTGAPDRTACNDGNPCTTRDACLAGKCQGAAVTCPATGNACVESFCDPRSGACLRAPLDGRACDDGIPATTGEICLGGTCAVVGAATDSVCPSQSLRATGFQRDATGWQAARNDEEVIRSYDEIGAGDPESLAFSQSVVIPVVFHVLQNPAARTVSDADIHRVLDSLNGFYGSPHFVQEAHSAVASGTHIQFQLAARSPTCGATDGIDRVNTDTAEFVAPATGGLSALDPWADPALGGAAAWNPRKYLNVWVAAYRPGNVPAGSDFFEQARARFPESAGRNDDGLVITTSTHVTWPGFSPGAEMVIAHELGHYLNLLHTDTPNDGNIKSGRALVCAGAVGPGGATTKTCDVEGDDVCDTPATKDTGSANCSTSLNTCTDSPVDGTDLVESIMLSTSGSCKNLFTFGQASRAEGTLATVRSSLLASDGNVPPQAASDLWIRDGVGDVGQEPNDLQVVWASDDIWVRRQLDGQDVQEHENPIFRPGDPNHVYVRVRNKSCSSSAESTTVTLRWAKASVSLGWPQPWDGKEALPNGAVLGGTVGTPQATGLIGPGESKILAFDWEPPDPNLYVSDGGDQSHFCLLANIGTLAGTPQDLFQMVQGSNDVAWKNVDVTSDVALRSVAVGMSGGQPGSQQLRFTGVDTFGSPDVFGWGRVVVDLHAGLFVRWTAGGQKGTGLDLAGISGTRVPLARSGATFDNIVLQPDDRFTMGVQFVPFVADSVPARGGLDVYKMDVTQLSEQATPHRVVGGQRFVLKTRRPAVPPIPPIP